MERLVGLPVRERIGRFKYVPGDEVEQEYEEILHQLALEIDEAAQKEEDY